MNEISIHRRMAIKKKKKKQIKGKLRHKIKQWERILLAI